MSHISDHETTKTRKMHNCRVCGEIIEPGERCHIYRGIVRGEGPYTIYFHPECWDGSRDWTVDEWECISPGEVSRAEMAAAAMEGKQ